MAKRMTPEQIRLVQKSFERVIPVADKAARLFYFRLFELDPTLPPLFSKDMDRQSQKFMVMLRSIIKSLDRIDEILPSLQAMGRRHIGYGTTEADYDTICSALLWALSQVLGLSFTPETRAAWRVTYHYIASIMKEELVKAA